MQVLGNADGGESVTVTLCVNNLDAEIERLTSARIAVPDPVGGEGFDSLLFHPTKGP